MKMKINIKILLTILITTIISFIVRYLVFKYFNIDIVRVDINPFCGFLAIFSLNSIRLLVKSYLDEYIPNTLAMNISDILNTPSPEPSNSSSDSQGNNLASSSNNQGNNPASSSDNQGNNPANFMGNRPYVLDNNGRYLINDPTGVGNRGYIDPNTNIPYLSNQPYASNLASAMENNALRRGNFTVG